jgi:hypothetical protein
LNWSPLGRWLVGGDGGVGRARTAQQGFQRLGIDFEISGVAARATSTASRASTAG